ncbi:conserved hypothetical protein [Candidatus Zixiibacteriota bacterium]|nr:conserved hypothetical protein [candidate division Zixibacteria bacterium]
MNGFCHIEIPCTDLKRISKFYNSVFSWESKEYPEMQYIVFKAPEGVSGGFSKDLKAAPKGTGPLMHIMVNDIEAYFKKIEASGGKTVRPKTAIPGIGHYGVFSDTEGNEIAMFTPQM